MSVVLSRRKFLAGVGAMAGAAIPLSRRAQAAPRATVGEKKVISHLAHRYHGWPTLARRANGQLLLVCSGGRAGHVCPFGRV